MIGAEISRASALKMCFAADAGLPDGFLRAAHDIYTRITPFKDAPETPELADVLAALLNHVETPLE
ncbi:MAG: hypothetical protein LC121_19970 [Anaerolineae bacterium]|nr:hypothetical protein [Anaerolineae bacterium]